MSSPQVLQRTTFERSRASEYFDRKELQAQTGQPASNFASVALKELVDNALDACETARVAPEIGVEVDEKEGLLRLSVADNGCGMPLETVEKILNFGTRTSDKATYRSPSRGLQGNALKTVLGIPTALGSEEPVVIEARGVRHVIRAAIDPAGELRVDHREENANGASGTRVEIQVSAADQNFKPDEWAAGFALFNPHAFVKFCDYRFEPLPANEHGYPAEDDDGGNAQVYKPTVEAGKFKKFMPTDPISAHWYDLDSFRVLLFSHIAHARGGGRDLPLGEFVGQFRRLSSSAKRKAVSDTLPGISHLSDFDNREGQVGDLLRAMQEFTEELSVKVLGSVGKAHFREFFEAQYGPVKRIWYKTATGQEGGAPYLFEIAVAETTDLGGFHHGVNFSPTFTDPLGSTKLEAGEIEARGMWNFISQAHASPSDSRWWSRPNTAVAFHLITPNPTFLDRGKTRLEAGPELANGIATAAWAAVKTLYSEEEKRQKDAARQEERDAKRKEKERKEAEREAKRREEGDKPLREPYLTEAVPQVMEEAWRKATGNGSMEASARTLFYQVRPLVQKLTTKELKDSYFTNTLLPAYQRNHRVLPGIYYEPRGTLYEPHDGGKVVPLGTRETQAYAFPKYLYNKILFIEKKGLYPALQSARLGERWDMAIVAGEGFASEAARTLFENAQEGDYELYVVHDADPDGYNIARTLREETSRMPGYSVNVVDLGLWLGDALERGLETETFTRQKALPKALELTEAEREYFEGRHVGRRSWVCHRVELNALSTPELAGYIEKRLAENGAAGKVIPPDDMLEWQANIAYSNLVRDSVERKMEELFPTQDIMRKVKTEVVEEFADRDAPGGLREKVETDFRRNPAVPWKHSVTGSAHSAAQNHRQEREDRIAEKLIEKIGEALRDGEGENG